MELVPFKPAAGAGALVEAGSIPAMVAAQQATLHAQVDQLQRLVVAQCHLTGVNPLAQEMVRSSLFSNLRLSYIFLDLCTLFFSSGTSFVRSSTWGIWGIHLIECLSELRLLLFL
jgi:hypothetical protein